MRRFLLVLIVLFCIPGAFAQGPVELTNTHTFTFSSSEVGDDFLIKVALPRGYEDSGQSYPVLYVTDAETNFGGLQYVTQRLAKDDLIPDVIVIGVAYDVSYDEFYRLRERDLRPEITSEMIDSNRADMTKGQAQVFANFLREELITEIDMRYRTVPGDRAYYGHSYGGLFGIWSLMYEPDLFSRYVILSPSLWWGEMWGGRPRRSHGHAILPRLAAENSYTESNARVFVASGELEPRIDELQADWVAAIRPNLDPSVNMIDIIYENETHRTIFGRGIMDGLRHVYGDHIDED